MNEVRQRVRDEDEAVSCGCLHLDAEEVVRYFKEEMVYSVQIESNHSCPQGCRYCYASADGAPVHELPAEDISAVLYAAATMDVKAIDWLGGDPLCRPDWYELMVHAADLGFVNNIWTSGMPLADPAVARRAIEMTEGGFISVHLDSLNPGVYGQLHTGNAEEKIRAISRGVETVLALGKPASELVNCITFTHPLAGDDVKATMRHFCEDLGMKICLTQICAVGLAEVHPEWIPALEEIRDACRERDRICYPGSSWSLGTMDVNKFYCGGMVCVTVDGDVTPCSVIRKGYGNIRERSLRKIVDEHRDELLFSRMRQPGANPSPCTWCEQSAVCWGCRALAYYETGDICGADPKCWRAAL